MESNLLCLAALSKSSGVLTAATSTCRNCRPRVRPSGSGRRCSLEAGLICRRKALAALLPRTTGNDSWIDIAFLPPLPFLAGGVDVVVVNGTKWHGELVTDLQAQSFGLSVADVVRM